MDAFAGGGKSKESVLDKFVAGKLSEIDITAARRRKSWRSCGGPRPSPSVSTRACTSSSKRACGTACSAPTSFLAVNATALPVIDATQETDARLAAIADELDGDE